MKIKHSLAQSIQYIGQRQFVVANGVNRQVQECDEIRHDTVLHSDRGVQYRGNVYQGTLRDYAITCSLSRTGDYWDNALMELFYRA